MNAATVLVHDLAGRPAPAGWKPDPGDAVCAMCARTATRTMPAARALGGNFTDPSLWARPDSTRVCDACTWCCAGRPPATIRGWTVLAAPGAALAPCAAKAWPLVRDRPGLCVTNRADPLPVARLLIDPPAGPWAATVAVSGQKHTLPYTRVNHGSAAWTVRLENTDVTAAPGTFRTVLRHAAALRLRGHGADAVREGTVDLHAVHTRADLADARLHLEPLAPFARSPLLDLALWCLTKTSTPTLAETL